MCVFLEPEVILANGLLYKKTLSRMEFHELASGVRAIDGVCPITADDAVESSIEHYSQIFAVGDDVLVKRVPQSENFFKEEHIDSYFNSVLPVTPADTKEKFKAVFRDYFAVTAS